MEHFLFSALSSLNLMMSGAQDIRDIKGPVLPDWLFSVLFAGMASLLLILFIAGYWFTKRQMKKAFIPLSPYEAALKSIEDLECQKTTEQVSSIYHELSHIIRHYLDESFGMHASEQTTEELMTDIEQGNSQLQKQRELLQDFLTHCDSVKFAGHNPSEEEIRQSFQTAREIIKLTGETQTT